MSPPTLHLAGGVLAPAPAFTKGRWKMGRPRFPGKDSVGGGAGVGPHPYDMPTATPHMP